MPAATTPLLRGVIPAATDYNHSFPMTPDVLITRDGVIATVTLHNPRKLNALTVTMWQTLRNVMAKLSQEESLRCVVVRGAGTDAFAAGADIAEFAHVRDNAEQGLIYHNEHVYGALKAIGECRHPTIAM